MSKRRIATLAVTAATLVVTGSPARAQGTSGLEFLTVPLGARPAALGNAYTGFAQGLEGILFNPAAAASVDGFGVSLSVLDAADIFHQSLFAVGVPILGEGLLALSINYQRFEPIPLTDTDANQLGQFTPQTLVMGGTFGYRWSDRFGMGVTAKLFYSELLARQVSFLGPDFSGTASGVAFDVGLTYALGTGNPLQLGIALLDLGPDPTYNREADQLPTRLRVGLAVYPVAAILGAEAQRPVDLMFVTDGVVTTGDERTNRASLGYGIELGLARVLYLRAGVPAQHTAEDSRPLRYGVGLRFGVFRFDMAQRLSEHPVLGQETQLSMNLAL